MFKLKDYGTSLDYLPLPESEFKKKYRTQSYWSAFKEVMIGLILVAVLLGLGVLVYAGVHTIIACYVHNVSFV